VPEEQVAPALAYRITFLLRRRLYGVAGRDRGGRSAHHTMAKDTACPLVRISSDALCRSKQRLQWTFFGPLEFWLASVL